MMSAIQTWPRRIARRMDRLDREWQTQSVGV
jgi:hypothetical protein